MIPLNAVRLSPFSSPHAKLDIALSAAEKAARDDVVEGGLMGLPRRKRTSEFCSELRPLLSLPLLSPFILSSIAMGLFGYDTGVVSGALVTLASDLDLGLLQEEIAVSATVAFAAVATALGVPVNTHYGRRQVVIIASMLYTAGAGVIAAAQGFGTLFIGRALLGLAIGFASGTVPMYNAEMAPAEVRGMVVTLNDLSIVTGQLVAGIVNGAVMGLPGSWRVSMGLAALPAIVLWVGFYLVPESPRWLVQVGRDVEAEAVLRRIHGRDDVSPEMAELQKAIGMQPDLGSGSSMTLSRRTSRVAGGTCEQLATLWSERPLRRAAMLGIGMMAMNQLVRAMLGAVARTGRPFHPSPPHAPRRVVSTPSCTTPPASSCARASAETSPCGSRLSAAWPKWWASSSRC